MTKKMYIPYNPPSTQPKNESSRYINLQVLFLCFKYTFAMYWNKGAKITIDSAPNIKDIILKECKIDEIHKYPII